MTNLKKTYEAMFLVDASNPDFEAASEPIRTVLDRSKAEMLSIKPWDERRLAYEIRGRRRGLYVLTYFNADPSRVVEIEHDCQLDEKILRVLILTKDHLSEDELNAETPATLAARRAAASAAQQQAAEEEKPAVEEVQEKSDATAKDSEVAVEEPANQPEEAPAKGSSEQGISESAKQGEAETDAKPS